MVVTVDPGSVFLRYLVETTVYAALCVSVVVSDSVVVLTDPGSVLFRYFVDTTVYTELSVSVVKLGR